MKNLLKIKEALSNRRGETLMESIASLVILVILFAGITLMLATAFRITGIGARESGDNQAFINNAVLGGPGGADGTLTLTVDGHAVDIDVLVFEDGGFTAFAPPAPTPGG